MPVSVMDAPGNAIKTVATDDLGDYRFGGLAAGTYLVAINQFSVDAAAGHVARAISYYLGMPSAEMAQPLVVAPGDQKSGVDFAGATLPSTLAPPWRRSSPRHRAQPFGLISPAAEAAGWHWNDSRPGDAWGDGFPVARANVTALTLPTPGGAPNIGLGLNAVTDEDGRYEFAEVMRGRYRIRVQTGSSIRPTGNCPPRRHASRRRRKPARTQIDILLPRHSAIAGQVVDDFGDPVEGVAINVWVIQFQAAAAV